MFWDLLSLGPFDLPRPQTKIFPYGECRRGAEGERSRIAGEDLKHRGKRLLCSAEGSSLTLVIVSCFSIASLRPSQHSFPARSPLLKRRGRSLGEGPTLEDCWERDGQASMLAAVVDLADEGPDDQENKGVPLQLCQPPAYGKRAGPSGCLKMLRAPTQRGLRGGGKKTWARCDNSGRRDEKRVGGILAGRGYEIFEGSSGREERRRPGSVGGLCRGGSGGGQWRPLGEKPPEWLTGGGGREKGV